MKTQEIKRLIRAGYAWPGGYQIFLVTEDGGTLCCDCARREYRQIVWDKMHDQSNGWNVIGSFLDCDTDDLICCDHCGKVFQESAYPFDEIDNEPMSEEELAAELEETVELGDDFTLYH
jgi:hypothetical protein